MMYSLRRDEFCEVFQYLQANPLTFLRVKLNAINIFVSNSTNEMIAIIGLRQNIGLVFWDAVIGMGKVSKVPMRNII